VSIYGINKVRRKIDTCNGGATCLTCRNYEAEHRRMDPMFGVITERSWCGKLDRKVYDINEGQDCLAYLKRIYSGENKMGTTARKEGQE